MATKMTRRSCYEKDFSESGGMDYISEKYPKKSYRRKQNDFRDEEFEKIQRDVLKKRKRS